MLVKAKWLDLLYFMYKKYSFLGDDYWLSFKNQKILKSVQFYKIMDCFMKLNWVKVREIKKSCIVKKEFCLTRKGFIAMHEVLLEVMNLDGKYDKN